MQTKMEQKQTKPEVLTAKEAEAREELLGLLRGAVTMRFIEGQDCTHLEDTYSALGIYKVGSDVYRQNR